MATMKNKLLSYLDVYDPDCSGIMNPLANNMASANHLNTSEIQNQVYNVNHGTAPVIDAIEPENSGNVFSEPVKTAPKQPAKKGRKVKSNKTQWRKEKGNKYLNKPYKNYKGVEIKSKEFLDYDCKCQLKCREILSVNERKQEFTKFWELGSYEAQAIFLIARVDEQVTKASTARNKEKRKYRKSKERTSRKTRSSKKHKKEIESENDDTEKEEDDPEKGDDSEKTDNADSSDKVDNSDNVGNSDKPDNSDNVESGEKEQTAPTPEVKKSKRQFSRTYILKSKQVCRNMFVKTLGITSKRINTALVKMRSKSLTDHRGLSQGGKNKISDKRYDEVVEHIKKMPHFKCSHLQGKFDSDILPPELSLSKMYDLYVKEVEQPVSLSMYKKIYYGKFNFKTKGLKKEICNICKTEKKVKKDGVKKKQMPQPQMNTSKQQFPCHTPPNDHVVLQQPQYRAPPNFMPTHTINCNQTWLPPPNFQMPQHNPAQYFDQPMGYE